MAGVSLPPRRPLIWRSHGAPSRPSTCAASCEDASAIPQPIAPLYRTVADTARAAAFEDTRFPPLRAEEISELEVSLSVLSPLSPVIPEQIEVGRHGLVVSLSNHRGLLLPQVPVEHGWDRTTFLEQTCRKAGLPTDAWEHGAKLEAFTAEIFGDREP